MPLLGLFLQHKDGSNLMMHSKSGWTLQVALQVTRDFSLQLAQFRKEDLGPLGLRQFEPHFAAGRIVSMSFYQVAYELISDVYLAIVQHVDDNPFFSDVALQKAKNVIATTIRSERLGFEEMQKKYGELWLALEKTLEPARGDAADDVITIDKKTSESRDMIDTLFAVDFEIPGQILPEPHPFTFGQVYGDAANSSTSKLGRRSATLSSKKSGKATSTADGKKDRRSRRSSTTSPSTSPAMANPEKKPRASSKATKPAQASTSKTLAKPPKPDGSSSTATTTPPPAISIAVPTEKSGNTMSQSTDRLMVGQSASPAEDRSTPGSEAAKTSAGASAATSQKNPDGKITLGSSAPKDGPIASSGSTNWADEDDEDIPEPPEDDGLAFSDSDQDEGNADYTFSGETPRLESPTQSDEEESDEYIIPIQSFISRPNRASRGPDSDLAITPRMMNEDLELSGSHLPGPSYETDSE